MHPFVYRLDFSWAGFYKNDAMKKDKAQQLIVFDMDGVLIDVAASYRDVVRQTARLFLQPAPSSFRLPDPLFSLADLAAVKQGGGLNNDWELTYFVLGLLFTLVEKPKIDAAAPGWEGYDREVGGCGIDRLVQFLRTAKTPLQTLLKDRKDRIDPFVRKFSDGEVGNGNVIKQIFQEVYLGADLFTAAYGMPPRLYKGRGYIYREVLTADRALLAKLHRSHLLAIATGRPKNEADFALDRQDLRACFDRVYTLDDCLQEEKRILEQEGRRVALSKPEPYMLDAIAASVEPRPIVAYYVGDMPDDMRAAARSRFGFVGIGFISSAPDRQLLRRELLRAGADYIVEDLAEVAEIVAI